jgi:hypothetical protein
LTFFVYVFRVLCGISAAVAWGYMAAATTSVPAGIYPRAAAAATAAAIALKFHTKHEKRKQKMSTKRTNSH